MAWYSVDERLLTIRLAPKIAQPVTCQPLPRSAACTTITTRAATESPEAMPEVMLLAISSPRVLAADDRTCAGCRHRPNHSRRGPSCHTLRTGRYSCAVNGEAGDVLVSPARVMESRSCQRPAALAVAAIIGLLV